MFSILIDIFLFIIGLYFFIFFSMVVILNLINFWCDGLDKLEKFIENNKKENEEFLKKFKGRN